MVLNYLFIVSSIAHADSSNSQKVDLTPLENWVGNIFTIASGIIASLAILVIIFAGYRYITSAGNPEQATKAKNLIITALASLILVILAVFIIQAINPNIHLQLNLGF